MSPYREVHALSSEAGKSASSDTFGYVDVNAFHVKNAAPKQR